MKTKLKSRKLQKNPLFYCAESTMRYTIIPNKRSLKYNKNIHYMIMFPLLPYDWKTKSRGPTEFRGPDFDNHWSRPEIKIRRLVSADGVAKMPEPD